MFACGCDILVRRKASVFDKAETNATTKEVRTKSPIKWKRKGKPIVI